MGLRRAAGIAIGGALALVACFDLNGFSGGSADAGAADSGSVQDAPSSSDAPVTGGTDAATTDAAAPSCGVAGPTNGLLAYYPFDEADGGASADCSGNGLGGTFVRQATDGGSRTSGVFGGAIHVNALEKNGCVSIGLASSLQVEPFSVAVWLKVDTFPDTPGTSATGYVMGQTVNAQYGGWRIGSAGVEGGGGSIAWQQGMSDGGSTQTVKSWPNDGGWHHYAITIETNAINAYVDGAFVSPTGPSFPVAFSQVAATIGCREDDGNYFDGEIDELRYYGRVLSTDEIAKLAQR